MNSLPESDEKIETTTEQEAREETEQKEREEASKEIGLEVSKVASPVRNMVAAKRALKKLRNSMIDEVAQEIVLDEVAKKAIEATGRVITLPFSTWGAEPMYCGEFCVVFYTTFPY